MRPRAFTLIELLVVVAIIALLIAILLPSLRGAREQARIAVCLGNYRNILLATTAYLHENDERFPFLVKSSGSNRGTSSWFYGGKAVSSHWKTRNGGTHYYTASERPVNRTMFNRVPAPDEELPQYRCPSDRTGYQRIILSPTIQDPLPISAYNDIGTTYHFNILSMYDVIGDRLIGEWDRGGEGWHIRTRALLRDVLRYTPSTYVFYYEDPVDYGLVKRIPLTGTHGAFNRHALGFVDGHAAYLTADTSHWCGVGYTFINQQWIWDRWATQPMCYRPSIRKNCD